MDIPKHPMGPVPLDRLDAILRGWCTALGFDPHAPHTRDKTSKTWRGKGGSSLGNVLVKVGESNIGQNDRVIFLSYFRDPPKEERPPGGAIDLHRAFFIAQFSTWLPAHVEIDPYNAPLDLMLRIVTEVGGYPFANTEPNLLT
jgi:hypothetical protein